MTSRDFCFWLQGFFELQAAANNHEPLNAQQIGMVKAHLALVFKHAKRNPYAMAVTRIRPKVVRPKKGRNAKPSKHKREE